MRQPPKFAKDQWCWDYTREKINGNHYRKHGYELSYEDWEAKHFMGAAAIYKRVVAKYGEGREGAIERLMCPKCESNELSSGGDYLCEGCRYGY